MPTMSGVRLPSLTYLSRSCQYFWTGVCTAQHPITLYHQLQKHTVPQLLALSYIDPFIH